MNIPQLDDSVLRKLRELEDVGPVDVMTIFSDGSALARLRRNDGSCFGMLVPIGNRLVDSGRIERAGLGRNPDPDGCRKM